MLKTYYKMCVKISEFNKNLAYYMNAHYIIMHLTCVNMYTHVYTFTILQLQEYENNTMKMKFYCMLFARIRVNTTKVYKSYQRLVGHIS